MKFSEGSSSGPRPSRPQPPFASFFGLEGKVVKGQGDNGYAAHLQVTRNKAQHTYNGNCSSSAPILRLNLGPQNIEGKLELSLDSLFTTTPPQLPLTNQDQEPRFSRDFLLYHRTPSTADIPDSLPRLQTTPQSQGSALFSPTPNKQSRTGRRRAFRTPNGQTFLH